MLSKLAINYYRPDFTEGQARSQISDMVRDLEEFPTPEIDMAITIYRQTPAEPGKAKYFPADASPLRAIILRGKKDRADAERIGPALKNFDSRPIGWWMQRKRFWKPHWREDEVPPEHRQSYLKTKAKQEAA